MESQVVRRGVRVRGVVQGVGFRPAMFRLARSLGLVGFVRNDREGVWLEIEGASINLDRFLVELPDAAPAAARIDRVETIDVAPRLESEFSIAKSPTSSVRDRGAAAIPADLAPCADCLRELADPADRRYRYPFNNCTACGPRFTIVQSVPYDRPQTTMATFVMCAACRREYDDPTDRRFHAEPIACPVCGPRVQLVESGVVIGEGNIAMLAAATAIAAGAIIAIKGAGGFVLAASATDEAAVAKLRVRKHRPHKPFAVMGRSLEALEQIAVLDDEARALLASPTRPIVLVPARPGLLAASVHPGLTDVGVYLPPTPLQRLLLSDGPTLQVMTSGNLSEEPIARTNEEAFAKLGDIADVFLVHDREVHNRCDDSVVRRARSTIPIRRARGIVPAAIELPFVAPPVLAVGAQERVAVCLLHDGRAMVSQHLGDLDHPDTEAFFREAIANLVRLADAEPVVIAHDLHPDYRATRWALAQQIRRVAVQHHHAHVAACLAEHGRVDRVVGVAFDGTGLGDDGSLWGGEILEADLDSARRLGHLRAIKLVGGEAAIRQPWRLAIAALVDAGETADVVGVRAAAIDRVRSVLATPLAVPATGAGRWFDAVAAMLGCAHEISYDGQAAAQLEALADGAPDDVAPFELDVVTAQTGAPFELDLRPAIRELVHALRRGHARELLAARFHATLAAAIERGIAIAGARTVALTGGCFQNRRLLRLVSHRLETSGIEVLVHRRVPPNDGGIALGQAAIAAFRNRSTPCA
ncbi:MAG TPA: carbamoyltransferase HypF [Kofleriaceae bacterium]|jgi:hydrogenase maturation protein HypF|nr:carbamoyltransferase HypF [Kofleriaceae bacterium]